MKRTVVTSAVCGCAAAGLYVATLSRQAIESEPPRLSVSYSNTTVELRFLRTNLLAEYEVLWSPYSNCCFYPLPMDHKESGGWYDMWRHDMRAGELTNGFWRVEKIP